jgi:hypothetical protein
MTNLADSPPETHLPPGPRTPRPMGPAFFLWIGLGVIFILAAVLVSVAGPKLWPKAKPHPAAVATAPAADPGSAAQQARIAELQQELDDARRAAVAANNPALQTGTAQALNARIERLETAQRRTDRAASAAIAAGALADAAQTSRPFVGELASLERLMPQSPLIAGLRPLAETGAPTRAALAAEFSDVAARAATAAHAPKQGASFLSRALAALGSLVTIRRMNDLTGGSADAVLARAERRANEGDIEGALDQMRGLPPSAQAATADWRERARRRVEIESRIARLRAAALQDLSDFAQPADPGAHP